MTTTRGTVSDTPVPARIAQPEGEDVVAPASPAPGRRALRWFSERRVARLIELAALLPVLATLLEVLRAPRLQFLDYWWVFYHITSADGSFRPEGLLRLQNEHPLGLPSLLYWMDARLFGGDQRVLGVVAVLLAVATVLLIRVALPKSLSPAVRASIVFTGSFLIFTLHGLHYYSRGMSGVAWLGANVLVVAALVLAFRGRWAWAMTFGILASISYGTAFAVWPVLLLVAIWNRESLARRVAPVVIGAVVAAGWLVLSWQNGLATGTAPANDLGSLLFRYLTLLGHVWTAESTAVAAVVGGAMLGGYALLLTTRAARDPQLRFWWAFALLALLACGLVALARIDFGASAALWSRYTSVSVMASLPLLVLTVAVAYPKLRDHWRRIPIVVLAAGLLGYALGAISAAQVRGENHMHALQAVSMRLGFANAFATLDWPLPDSHVLIPRMRAIGHYPFNDDFSLGCGGAELGTVLDRRSFRPVHPQTQAADGWRGRPAGELLQVENRYGPAQLFTGWFGNRDPVRCVVLADDNGKIVGGGVLHNEADIPPPRSVVPGNVAFTVIGREGAAAHIVAITDDGGLLTLPVPPAKQPDQN
jgi:hypothetical protein